MTTEKNKPQNQESKERLNRNEQSSSSSRRESDLGTNRSSSSSNQKPSGNMDRKNTSRK